MIRSKVKIKSKAKGRSVQKRDDVNDLIKAVEEFEEVMDLSASGENSDKVKGDGQTFSSLPLSAPTQDGLKESHYMKLTDIQRKAIIPALKGQDILGAARTGSGKTLAFLVPVLDNLYKARWSREAGLGALILTPTRELAIQIFAVLRKIGRKHNQLSAALVIGGKDYNDEAVRLSTVNILIGTPGRVLQHMDQTAGFDTSTLQMLVLDEADRILDMGFRQTIDNILENLPKDRQTLLFSATQTKSVADLARLSLSEPTFISVHEKDAEATPKSLKQVYITIPLPHKLSFLYYFLRTHLQAKILVFMSSSKQVRYVYETFRAMRPGISLLHLHGKQKQAARIDVVAKFSTQPHVCLLATDVVARGIDFPSVDWVVQVDAPEDAATYIHRVGRSARYGKNGSAVLLVTPKEEPAMIAEIRNAKVPIEKNADSKLAPVALGKALEGQTKQGSNSRSFTGTRPSQEKLDISADLQNQCFQNPEIKYLAQKAFVSYVRSVYIQKNKAIFKLEDLPLDEFAKSLGLPGAPNVKIVGQAQKHKEAKNAPRQLMALAEDNEARGLDKPRNKYDRMFNRQNQNVLSEHYTNLIKEQDSDHEEDFMKVKSRDQDLESLSLPDLTKPQSKRQAKAALSKKQSIKNKGNPVKLVFDEEGNPHQIYEFKDEEDFRKDGDALSQKRQFITTESEAMAMHDVEDKQVLREKRQEKKRKRKEIERRALAEEDGDTVAVVGPPSGDEEDYDEEGSLRDDDYEADVTQKKSKKHKVRLLEVDEPETLEDMESLATELLRK